MKKGLCFEYNGYCFFCVELTAALRSLLMLHNMSSLTNMLRNPVSSVAKWHWMMG